MADLRNHVEKLFALAEIERAGSISKAAAKMRLSQPALSQSLQILEDALGVQIFERGPKGSQLTQVGSKLVHFSNRLSAELDALEANLKDCPLGPQFFLSMGADETTACEIWPKFSKALKALQPTTITDLTSDIAVRTAEIDDLVDALFHREIHFFISKKPRKNPELLTTELARIPFCYYVNQDILRKFGRVMTRDQALKLSIFTNFSESISQGNPLVAKLFGIGFERFPFELNTYQSAFSLAQNQKAIVVAPACYETPEGMFEIEVEGLEPLPSMQLCLTRLVNGMLGKDQEDAINQISHWMRKRHINTKLSPNRLVTINQKDRRVARASYY